jgi:citrate lyase beta subunit
MMIRSLLVVPPLVPDMLDKSLRTEADAILVELEDGVHRNRKDEAREVVARFIERRDFAGKTVVVRVNDVLTQTGQDDLRALAAVRAPFLLLPKIRSRADVDHAEGIVKRAETEASVPVGGTRLWLMVETTDAVLDLPEIAQAPRLSGLVMGSADLSSELRVRRIGVGANRPIWDFPLELLYAKQRAVLVARSRGLTILDTGYTTFRDLEGMRHSALVSAQLGFDGTAAFSPRQVGVIHEQFTPTADEYDWACRAVKAVDEAEQQGETVVVLDGEMVEGPLVRSAYSIVQRYEEYAARDRARGALTDNRP